MSSTLRWHPRATTPKLKDGKVQRKNRSAPTPNYEDTPQPWPVIDRRRPGPAYRHVLKVAGVEWFIRLLPEWREPSKGLNAIVLAPEEPSVQGRRRPGVVAVCAWPRGMHEVWDTSFCAEHEPILERLAVPCGALDDGRVLCKFTEASARGFQLLHALLHELGHHRDRMSTRSQRRASRGEECAERCSLSSAELIWDRYVEVFGW